MHMQLGFAVIHIIQRFADYLYLPLNLKECR